MINKIKTIFIIIAVVTVSASFRPTTQAASTVTIDWNDVHQQIDGFGASSACFVPGDGICNGLTTTQADLFFSTTNGIGLSLLRNHINPDGTTKELSIMQQAVARGAKVWSTPWSPPAAWKSNNSINNGGQLLTSHYQDYANQLAAYVANMKASGVPLYAVSIQNEPDLATSYESCQWSAQQFHDFIPYLYNALAAKAVSDTKIMIAEQMSWYFDLTSTALNDASTAAQVGIVSAHGYRTDSPGGVDTKSKPLWETETCTFNDSFDASMGNALTWANNIHQFLTAANVTAWHYWWLMAGGDNEGLADRSGNPTKRMYVLGNFSKFVRPGYVRIGTSGAPSGVLVSAYKDSSTGNFVIVAINQNSSNTSFTATLNGGLATSVTPWITSASLNLAQQSAVALSNSSFTYTLPASSVVTFVGQNSTPPPAAPKYLRKR